MNNFAPEGGHVPAARKERMKGAIRRLWVALLVLPMGGCITVMGRTQVANGPTIQEITGTPVYASTAYDMHLIGDRGSAAPLLIPIVLLDMPFALIVDTLLFIPDLATHGGTHYAEPDTQGSP